MIVLDYNQVTIANLMMGLQNKHHTEVEVNVGILRHMVLNTIKTVNAKFRNDFGQMVIACDGGDYWRREVFPYYKALRKKSRDESPIDWRAVHSAFDTIASEIDQFMPMPLVKVRRAEADDVIAHLERTRTDGKFLIVSGDRDFVQLKKPDVFQWDHVRKRWVEGDARESLRVKIIKGDTGDGVPNFLSDDDVLVTPGVRQKSVMSAKLEKWMTMSPEEICDDDVKKRNWQRNETLVDLSKTPVDVRMEIEHRYAESLKTGDRATMREYFIQSGLKKLMEDVQYF